MAKFFLNTHILVYTVDKKDEEKTYISKTIIKQITIDHFPLISTQVLQEFYNATTSKLKLDKILIINIVHGYNNKGIVIIDLSIIKQAIDISFIF